MKKIIFFLGLLLTFSSLTAQKKVTETKKSSGIDEVFVHVKFADKIEVKNWDKNEISVEATVSLNNNQHNDYFQLKGDNDGGVYTIKSDYGTFFKDHGCNYYNSSKKNEKKKYDSNCKTEMDINYVIYVPRNMKLKVKSISGSVKADSYAGMLDLDLISGNIDIKKHSKNMKLKTISGDIDIYVSDATFEAKTLSGGIYSDLKIDYDKQNKYSGSRRIKATIKNGDASLKLSTISGDIFLRKS